MKKLFKILSLIFALSGCGQESEKDTLRAGISPDFPPFALKKDNQLLGFEVDLMTEISKRVALKLVWVEMDFSALIPALNSKKIDVIISGLNNSPERAKSVLFTTPYYHSNFAMLVNSSSGISSIQQLESKIIGVQLGSTYESYMKSNFPNTKITSLNNNNSLVEELKLGRVDAVLLEIPQAKAFSANNVGMGYFNVENTQGDFAAALRLDDKELEQKTSKAISDFLLTEEYKDLLRKWDLDG